MNPRLRSILIIIGVTLLDRITKILIQNRVSEMDQFPVIRGFFNIVHTENPGAAFGFLAGSTAAWRPLLLVGVSVIVMIVIATMLWKPAKSGIPTTLMQVGLAFVFGGAAGNLWDRAVRGSVTDFLQFFFGSYEFPSFNAADSAISVGACLLLIDMWRERNKGVRSQESEVRM
jgi:signal peptidase II